MAAPLQSTAGGLDLEPFFCFDSVSMILLFDYLPSVVFDFLLTVLESNDFITM
jgi:hypothetical protein